MLKNFHLMIPPGDLQLHVQKVITAYETVLSPSATKEARKEAENYCEEVKVTGFGSLSFRIGLALLDARNAHPLHLRNLGANFIEACVKSTAFETNLSTQEQIWIRTEFYAFAFGIDNNNNNTNHIKAALLPEDRLILKEKVAMCVAILACRYWIRPEDDPLQWNEFFEIGLLEKVLNLNSQIIPLKECLHRQELALLTIYNLINLIRTPNPSSSSTNTTTTLKMSSQIFILSDSRRMQLHSGLEIILPSFTDWLFLNFPSSLTTVISTDHFPLIQAAILCFQSFCTWMGNLKSDRLNGFLTSVLAILLECHDNHHNHHIDLSQNILDSLLLLFSQRNFQPSEYSVVEHFVQNLAPQLSALLQRYATESLNGTDEVGVDDQDSSYQKLKTLIQCLLSVGNRFICHRKHPFIPKNITQFLELILSLSDLPSLSLYLDFLQFWTLLLRSEAFLQKFPIKPLISRLFQLATSKIIMNSGELRRSPCNKIDFEDIAEFRDFWQLSRNRSADLIKLITSTHSQLSLEYSYNAYGTFIQSQLPNEPNPIIWEGLLLVEESVSKIKEKGKDSDDSGSSCSEWYLKHLQLLTVHCPVPINPTVLSRWIAAVRNFSTLLSDSCPADDFRRTVECLFNIAITKNDLRPDEIKTSAAISILKLADSNPTLFLPLLEPLLAAISPLLVAPSGSWERKLFSELVLILMAQPSALSPERQMSLFSSIADPLVDLLKSAKALLINSSINTDPVFALMKQIGFDELLLTTSTSTTATMMTTTAISPACKKVASDFNLLLSTLQILFKRLAPLVQSDPNGLVVQTCLQVLDELVGFLMLMIQCLHKMNTKLVWCSYFNSDTPYLTIYPKMREYLDSVVVREESSIDDPPTQNHCLQGNTPSVAPPYIHIAGWSRHYRQTCYLVLGLAATCFRDHLYALPHFTERFMTQPLSSLESLALGDWNVLIKLMLKPVMSCAPAHLVPGLVGGSLAGLLALLGTSLQAEWTHVLEIASSTSTSTDTSVEIARESKCTTVSSGFIAFLTDLLGIGSNDSGNFITLLYALQQDNLMPSLETDGVETSGMAAKWFFTEAPINLLLDLHRFIEQAMLQWPRTVGVFSKLILIELRILSALMSRLDLPSSSDFLQESINCSLTLWSLPSWSDFHVILQGLFVEQYKWSFLHLAAQLHTGPMLFDTDTSKFVKSPRFSSSLTIFEKSLLNQNFSSLSITQADIFQLRPAILCDESVKGQRTAFRNFFQKWIKSSTAALTTNPNNNKSVAISDENKQRELSSRLIEMKKRIGRSPLFNEYAATVGQNDADDESLLSDLFN